jgi:1-aminocyclopropane-1-carboxylate deaminase
MKLHEFPRHPLTFGPSPVHHAQPAHRRTSAAPRIWAKREDVSSGLAYGGNKVRKLEYIVPDVLASGADTLVSIGGYQSNHTRQVAAVAAYLGLKCRLVQEKWVPWEDPVNDKVGNILLSRMMGADSRLDPRASTSASATRGRTRCARSRRRRHALPDPGRCVRTPARRARIRQLGLRGGRAGEGPRRLLRHDHRLHGHRLDPRRDDRRVRRLEDLTGVRRRVIGIDASATIDKTRDQVARIARHTAELIELGRDLRDDEITVLEGWAGDLYGIPVDSTMEAIRLGAQFEAMITDPVYEGKSLAGLIDLVRSGDIPASSHRALRPPRRPAGDQRLPPPLVVTWRAGGPVVGGQLPCTPDRRLARQGREGVVRRARTQR